MLDASPPTVASDAETAPTASGLALGVWAPERRRLTVGLVLTITLVAFESLAIATVLPTVERDLGGLALYGWVFSGFFLASLAGIVVTGIAADRRGPVVPFSVGLVVFALGLVVGGLAPSMPILVVARVAQGFGAGAIPASAYAGVARGYPATLRPRVFAVFATAWVIPGIVGPSLATLVEHIASWRWVFLGLLPLVAMAATMAIPALARLSRSGDEARVDEQRKRADRARLGLVSVLVVGVALVLAASTAGSLLLAVGLVAFGLPVAALAFLRLVPAGTLALRAGLPAVVGVRGLLTWAFFGADAYVSLAVVEGRGGSTLLAGLVLSVTAVLWTAGAWIQERWVGRLGPRRLDRIAFALLAVASTALLVVTLLLPAWLAVPAWGLAGFGMGLGYAPLSVSALGAARPGREGEATAALQLCDVLGVSIGAGVGGALIALSETRHWDVSVGAALAFAAGALVAAVGIVAAGRLPDRIPGA